MAHSCIPVPVLELKRPVTKVELATWGGWTVRFLDSEISKGRLKKCWSGKATRLMPDDIKDWINCRKSSEVITK